MRISTPALLAVAALTVVAAPIQAQLISLKTVPLATGDQFQLFPSDRVGLGAVGITVDDALADPVSSPATGARLQGVRFFSAPVLYDYVSRSGGGLTLPVGVLGSGERFFGGIAGAIQELRPTTTPPSRGGIWVADVAPAWYLPPQARDDSRVNMYAFGLAGLRLGEADAVALSTFGASLEAVQGVEEMYGGALAIVQDGWLADTRLGWLHTFPDGAALDMVLLHAYVDMVHDVAYENILAFDPTSSAFPVPRWEHNPDRTRTLGAYARYVRPLEDGWKAGVVMTLNRKTHPKIPNYRVMSIPKDPGVSTALSAGVGVSREADGVLLALDLLLEPAWTETWANATEPIWSWDSTYVMVDAGARSVENHFRFMNGVLRLGAGQDKDGYGVGAGLEMRSFSYHMTQYRFDLPWSLRRQDEHWIEWTPTWGIAVHLQGLDLRYDGRVTFGTGAHNDDFWSWRAGLDGFTAANATDFIPAPGDALNMDQQTVWTHMVSISLGGR